MEEHSSRRDDLLIDSNLSNDSEPSFEIEFPVIFPNLDSENDNDNGMRMVILKAFILENDGMIESIKLQMYSESDLYFLFNSEFTEDTFNSLKKSQSLDESLNFSEFPNMMKEIINKVAESKEFLAKFEFNDEEKGKLIFSQKLKFKEVEILDVDFEKAKDDEIMAQIQDRYEAMKNELKAAKAELNDLYTMLKIKNPTVLKQMRHSKK